MNAYDPLGIPVQTSVESLHRGKVTIHLASVPDPIPGLPRVEVDWTEDCGIIAYRASSEEFEQEESCAAAQDAFFEAKDFLEEKLGCPAVDLNEPRDDSRVWYEMIGDNLFFRAYWSRDDEDMLPGLSTVVLRIIPLESARSRVEAAFIIMPPELDF